MTVLLVCGMCVVGCVCVFVCCELYCMRCGVVFTAHTHCVLVRVRECELFTMVWVCLMRVVCIVCGLSYTLFLSAVCGAGIDVVCCCVACWLLCLCGCVEINVEMLKCG